MRGAVQVSEKLRAKTLRQKELLHESEVDQLRTAPAHYKSIVLLLSPSFQISLQFLHSSLLITLAFLTNSNTYLLAY